MLQIWKRSDDRLIPERPDRQTQTEQSGTAAHEHFPAERIAVQLATRVGKELDIARIDTKAPWLGVVH